MLKRLIKKAVPLVLAFCSAAVHALTVEAQGQAPIVAGDLEGARLQAIRDASEQALLQAGAYISSTQQVHQGVIQVDNLRVQSSGQLSQVRVVQEERDGALLRVRIRAEAELDAQCSPETPGQRYRKQVAVAGFPLAERDQANLGGFGDAEQAISRYLADALNQGLRLDAINASHLQVHANPQTAAGSQRPHGALTTALATFQDLDVQFIVSGVIRDLGMIDPRTALPETILKDLYDRLDYRGRQHLRQFELDLFIHDGSTGALLLSGRYGTRGLWNIDSHLRTGFLTPTFAATDYGQQVTQLLAQVGRELGQRLQCEPYQARILRTERNRIVFNGGSLAGIRPGDQFEVYRKRTFYDERQQARPRLEKAGSTLVVSRVQPEFSEGNLSVDTRELNIQQDDILIAW